MKIYLMQVGSSFLMMVLGISLLAFFLIRVLPENPVSIYYQDTMLSIEKQEEISEEYGFSDSLIKQYFLFLKDIFTIDFGKSFISNKNVVDEFYAYLPVSLEMGGIALLLAILLGIPLGMLTAVKEGTWIDGVITTLHIFLSSLPKFWIAIMFIIFFSVRLDLLPVSGRLGNEISLDRITGFVLLDSLLQLNFKAFESAILHLILPSVVLCLFPLSTIIRQTRASMIEVLSENYIKTARAKGISERLVLFRHGLRNSIAPIIATIGLVIANLISGSVVVETIFGMQGLGKWILQAIITRDYQVVQFMLFVSALFVAFTQLLVNLLLIKLNPILTRVENDKIFG